MKPAVQRVVDALEVRGCSPRQNGPGWRAQCPSHDDKNPSLSVNAGNDGRVLLKCHAGCALEDIVAALGLERRDLFEKKSASAAGETRYQIRDAKGKLVAIHVRRDGPSGKKFWWERNGKPGLDGLPVASLPLYGSEAVASTTGPVLLVEGERAADALRSRGFAVVASVCGAAATPRPEVLEVLRGREVVLWPDADKPGREHMRRLAEGLAGIAVSVREFEWVGAPERGDAHDYFAAGGAAERLQEELASAVTVGKHELAPSPPPAKDTKPARPRQGRELALADPEPWSESVDGAALADELATTTRRFVVLEPEAVTAVTLWALHAHAIDAAQVSPLAVPSSPTKRCGKTTLETVMLGVTPRPLMTSNVSPAALFRTIEKYRPTLIVDEADSFLKMSEELRGVLNAGHSRSGAIVVRAVGEEFEPRMFSTWGPKMVALIGRLPGTLEDRAIVIPMRRRKETEPVERLRLDRLAELEPLRRRAARWAQDNLDALRDADPEMPGGLHDRAQDNWRPLLAIADRIGGEWPARARKAAVALAGGAPETEDAGESLVRDLTPLITERRDRGDDAVSSEDVVAHLVALEGSPWPEWRDGKPITKTGVARLLRRFGVEPRQVRFGVETRKGYSLEAFDDALARYPLSEPKQSKQSAPDAGETDLHEAKREDGVSVVRDASHPHEQRLVSGVSGDPGAGGTRGPDGLPACPHCGGELIRWSFGLACRVCHRRVYSGTPLEVRGFVDAVIGGGP